MRLRTTALASIGAAVALVAPLAAPASAATTELAGGFVGPLGLAVAPNGTAYVAESFAGVLTAVSPSGTKTVVAGTRFGGVEGVEVAPGGRVAYLTLEEVGNRVRTRLIESGPRQTFRVVTDLYRHEQQNNPDAAVNYGIQNVPSGCTLPDLEGVVGYTGIVDAHPYALAAAPNGSYYIADAAANAILRVTRRGGVSVVALLPRQELKITSETLAVLNGLLEEEGAPPLPSCVVGASYFAEPVPTDVEIGPNGLLYVTTLPGGPESPALGPRGSVYTVNPTTGAVALVASGFGSPTGLAVTPTGDVYVAELFGNAGESAPPGTIRKVGGGVVAALPLVAALEWSNGALYATYDIFPPEDGPPDGKLVRITL